VAWLLGVVPGDFAVQGVLRRHPIALATLAGHYLQACVEGARNGYRTARVELAHLPPSAIEAVLAVYRTEGARLAATAKAADLVEQALRGEQFVPQLAGGRVTRTTRDSRSREDRQAGTQAAAGRPAQAGGPAGRPAQAGRPAASRPAEGRQATAPSRTRD
jgi:hypothetical protein